MIRWFFVALVMIVFYLVLSKVVSHIEKEDDSPLSKFLKEHSTSEEINKSKREATGIKNKN